METPKTLIEAIQKFSDKQFAHDYLVAMRWPEGVECPHCVRATGEIHNRVSFISTRNIWKCKECKKQFSVKVGTIFEDSPLGLDKWLTAIWILVSSKNGVSSYEIARSLGVKQESAWFMMHRIRYALETGSIEKMTGTVECDESFFGQKAKNMHADKRRERRAEGFPKITVMGLKERGGDVCTKVIPNREKETLKNRIEEVVAEGATLYTDSWKGYNGLSEQYEHTTVDHNSGQYVSGENGEVYTNGMENVWTLYKRTYCGTYTHFSDQHANRYLAEGDFRYNTRTLKDGERFAKTVKKIAGKRLTYAELTESHLTRLLPKT